MKIKPALILIIALLLTACGEKPSQERPAEQIQGRTLDYTGTVGFLDMDGNLIDRVNVAIADNDDSRRTGLMDVRHLPDGHGMLFIFDREEPLSFWMANTHIPLDIIFVNSAFEIVRIHRNTRPYSTDRFPSGVPAIYTVEVNAGYTARHDIQEGMTITIEQ